jgi:hypothetical protein
VLRRVGHQFVHHDAHRRAGVEAQDRLGAVRLEGEADAPRREVVEVARAAAERREVVPQVSTAEEIGGAAPE